MPTDFNPDEFCTIEIGPIPAFAPFEPYDAEEEALFRRGPRIQRSSFGTPVHAEMVNGAVVLTDRFHHRAEILKGGRVEIGPFIGPLGKWSD